MKMTRKNVRNFMFLFWICFLLTAALMLFLRGFFLTKIAFKEKNFCKFPNTYNTIKLQCSGDNNEPKCWQRFLNGSFCLPKSRHRAVILLIDALRYDFTQLNQSKRDVLPYENKLPIINEILLSRPKHTRLYQFIADPPSTTMQRLKSLTTGTLPTFIDAGSNFASSEIQEDNLIYQLEENGRRIVFLGDDTWRSLYPNSFWRKKMFPSFDVWDLDTVDTGIKINLYPELQRTDWHLLIAHFLGVDHCGHRYGPNHPEMARKLSEMDDMIRTVIHMLPDDAVLYVIGDHGMTKTGDHGGFTEDEITSTLFVYSSTQLFESTRKQGTKIKQINFIPTLASLFGIPIPFSNLGHIIPDILPQNLHSKYDVNVLKILTFLLWTNMQQISTYIANYSAVNQDDFTSSKMAEFNSYFVALQNHKFLRYNRPEHFEQYLNASEHLQKSILKLCESIWVEFDSSAMSRGLIMMLAIVLILTFIVIEFDAVQLEHLFPFNFLRRVLLVISGIVLMFSSAAVFISFKYEIYIYFYSLMMSVLIIIWIIAKECTPLVINFRDYVFKKLRSTSVTTYVCLAIILSFDSMQFSDNGIIYEGIVTVYCLMAYTTWIWFLYRPKSRNKPIRLHSVIWTFVLSGLYYFSSFFHACREETMHQCTNYVKDSIYEQLSCVLALLTLWIFITSLKSWLRNNGTLIESHWRCFMVKFLPTSILVCCCCVWVFEKFLDARNAAIKRQMNLMSYIIYTMIFSTMSIIIKEPVFLTVFHPRLREKESLQRKKKHIEQWKNHQKYSQNEQGLSSCPIIYGWVNVYSSSFVLISVFLILLMATLIGELLVPAVIIMYLTAAIFLFFTAMNRFERLNNFEELYDVPNVFLIGWFLMSVAFFYGTNHQATFPNIHWSAAFVGDLHLLSNKLAAIAIVVNTYCSQIFFAFMLPLLFLAPFQFQSTLATKFHCRAANFYWHNGEMVLTDHKERFHGAILQLFTKYILFHGIRVFFVMMMATIHCRHLMVWNIFAPKFIFEAIGLLVTLFAVLLSYLFLMRIQTKIDLFMNQTKLHD